MWGGGVVSAGVGLFQLPFGGRCSRLQRAVVGALSIRFFVSCFDAYFLSPPSPSSASAPLYPSVCLPGSLSALVGARVLRGPIERGLVREGQRQRRHPLLRHASQLLRNVRKQLE